MMNYKEHFYHEFRYTLDSPNRFVGGVFFINRCYEQNDLKDSHPLL